MVRRPVSGGATDIGDDRPRWFGNERCVELARTYARHLIESHSDGGLGSQGNDRHLPQLAGG